MLTIETVTKLRKVLQDDNYWINSIQRAFFDSATIIEREYKQQIPVDKGTARAGVKKYKQGNLNFLITTRVTNSKGIRYMEKVHEGTYDFRGDTHDYGGNGRVGVIRGRNARNKRGKYKKGAFDFIDANGGKKGIRPNKFADRTRRITEPQVNELILSRVKMIIGE